LLCCNFFSEGSQGRSSSPSTGRHKQQSSRTPPVDASCELTRALFTHLTQLQIKFSTLFQ
jgi:hypothetical protein